MPAKVLFHEAARLEYQAAFRRYARQASPQIAQAFCEQTEACIERIAADPDCGIQFKTHWRWVRLHRYPYLLYYRQMPDGDVMVFAVAHEARRLGYWVRRDH